MVSLAYRNLFHDKVRLMVTLTGIVFSVLLTAVQLGLFFGFTTATSDLIDHSGADIWITSPDLTHIEDGLPFTERKLYQALATPGVAAAEKHVAAFSNWKRPNGAAEGILLTGFNPKSDMGRPWNVVAGDIADLRGEDTVMVDELYREKLGVTGLGETVEIRGRRARVVGFTRGIRTFTTAPPVFTSFKNALNYRQLGEDQTLYILVKADPQVSPAELKARLRDRLQDVDVYTTAELSSKQRNYWMFGTGAGVSVLIAAGLGMLVGIVVVAQTIYAATVDHIREYGTLKAMGATNGYIHRVIVRQASMSGVMGYVIGISFSLLAAHASQSGTTAIIVSWPMVGALFGLTQLMCIGASMVSISKATRIDPAIVFKG